MRVRERVGAVPLGPLRLGAALVYVAGILLAPVVPARVVALFGLAALALAGAAWLREGRRATAPEAIWLWPPVHLGILATGGLASPLLPLLAAWIIAVGAAGTWVWAVGGAVAAVFLLSVNARWLGTLEPAVVAEMFIHAAIGCAVAWLFDAIRRRAEAERRTLARILSEAESGSDASPEAAAAGRLEQLEASLDGVRRRLGADRVVLWQLDDDLAQALLVSGGQSPGSVALSASPFEFVWREGVPLRLDATPPWAPRASAVWLVRVEGRAGRRQVMSAEFAGEANSAAASSLEEEARFLGAILRIHGREARAVAARDHLQRVVAVLERVAREIDASALARTLAASAVEVAGGTGAAVVHWDGREGCVVHVLGDDGGPPVGATFGEFESDTALAIRNEAAIVREDRRPAPGGLPCIAPGERWHAQPMAFAAVPLRAERDVLGAVVVWSGTRPRLDHQGVEVIEAVAPFAALQLRHALELGAARVGDDTDRVTGLPGRATFEERFRSECARAIRYGRPLALALLRIERPGGAGGGGRNAADAAMAAAATLVAAGTRDADAPARFDEHTIVILMPETDVHGARLAAERLCRQVSERTVTWRGASLEVRACGGVSSYPACVAEPEALIRSAADALEAAAGGKGRVRAAPAVNR